MAVDEQKLEALMGQLVGHMTGGAVCLGIWLGDELGFYRALQGAGPTTAQQVADKAGTNLRLTQEWLDSQAAGGLLAFDPAKDTYELTDEAALALADQESPVFVARAMNAFGSMFKDFEKNVAAFRGDGGLAWGDHHPCLFSGTEWFFRTGYRAHLPEWIQALDGVDAKLQQGAKVADVGCGHGASVVVMAQQYPASQFYGFDFHEPSIETSRDRAKEASVDDRTTFSVATAKDYTAPDGNGFDLICFFDCLHDMGDPVGIASYARTQLNDGGAILLVEPFALEDRPTNIAENPMATLLYTASSVVCTPNSLSQEVGLGLGAQAGEGKLRQVFEEAGFTSFRQVAATPFNLIIEAKP
jgi:2-polyprenyl-3-methyl-5-hydroxy-6-metoxy-1,4-benzoquinol methylase